MRTERRMGIMMRHFLGRRNGNWFAPHGGEKRRGWDAASRFIPSYLVGVRELRMS